ncbi:MAG: hypothetical protein R2783_09895 [Gelidibacter sp.]
MQNIDWAEYDNKCKQQAYKCLKYQTDSITLYKVLFKYRFGKIDVQEYNQIKNLVTGSKSNIGTDIVLVIKYIDSLRDYEGFKRQHLTHVKIHDSISKIESLGNRPQMIKHWAYNYKMYKRNKKRWIKSSKKCVKKFEKNLPVDVSYVYNFNQDNLADYEGLNLIKDRGALRVKFFNIKNNFNLLILKPDGEYFLSGDHMSDESLKRLIKNKDWSSYKSDWNATINTYKVNGTGMFRSYSLYYHKDHCF